MTGLIEDELNERQKLYELGMSDRMIAAKQGVHSTSVAQWRRRRGLPTNKPPGGTSISQREHRERLALYRLRWNDQRIANARGLQPNAIRGWRLANGLPAQAKVGGGRGGGLTDAENDRRMALYRRGRSDREIAATIGCSENAIAKWRERRSLERNGADWDRPATSIVSMDADLGESGFNRHGLVADDAAAQWLEEMGATRW